MAKSKSAPPTPAAPAAAAPRKPARARKAPAAKPPETPPLPRARRPAGRPPPPHRRRPGEKSSAKQAIFRATQATFTLLRQVSQQLCLELTQKVTTRADASVKIEYDSVNEMEFHIRFSGDLLIFIMHSNIVTFPEDFGPLTTPYVQADFRRRFFGHIMAYNFMADSIRYQRLNDPGYLLGRLLVNIDGHYFLEGVQQLELPDNDMSANAVTAESLRLFVESAMIAAVNNDLIAPPLPEIQRISVKQKLENQQVSRGSKVGFSFAHQQQY
ncbi:MAG: hypothetical protein WKG07_00445 [Hymenobacter sp.]